MKIQSFERSDVFAARTYVLENGGEFAVIDPSYSCDEIFAKTGALRENVRYIFLTHTHFDHMLTLKEWMENTRGELIVGAHDIPGLTDAVRNASQLFLGNPVVYRGKYSAAYDGDSFSLGEERITAYEMPGHTEGSLMFKAGENAFVGDLVFSGGGYGRTDLPSGDRNMLFRSIEKLLSFPSDMTVYPGHGEKFTLKTLLHHF